MRSYHSAVLYLGSILLLISQGDSRAGHAHVKEPVYEGKPLSAWIKALNGANTESRRKATEAIGKIGPKAAPAGPALLRAIKDQDVVVRELANASLIQIGEAAVPGLLEALKDNDQVIRINAAAALAHIDADAEGAVPILAEAMKDKVPHVRALAALAAYRQGGPIESIVPVLIDGLECEDVSVRLTVAMALAEIGPEAKAAVPALTGALKFVPSPPREPAGLDPETRDLLVKAQTMQPKLFRAQAIRA